MRVLILWALAGTSFLFLMTSLGAALVFLFREKALGTANESMLGFAGGVMTAAAVWSLLLPAIAQTAAETALPAWLPAALGILLGGGFLALIDRLEDGARGREQMLFTAITLHNIPEGMAVGLAFALVGQGESLASALALALGIGVQNFPEGAAVSLPLRQLGLSRRRAFLCGVASGTVEPLFGMLALFLAALLHPVMPWLLGFAAGAMLYVTARELIPAASGTRGVFAYLFGFLLMMTLDVALG